MKRCRLHTILRLPDGIFYANVTTNVLFFTRPSIDSSNGFNTDEVWIYDMRTNLPTFGKRNPLRREHFQEFEKAFGVAADGTSSRRDQGPRGRMRRFSREYIESGGGNLDISWLRNDSRGNVEKKMDPDELAAEIRDHLEAALEEIDFIADLLVGSAETIGLEPTFQALPIRHLPIFASSRSAIRRPDEDLLVKPQQPKNLLGFWPEPLGDTL